MSTEPEVMQPCPECHDGAEYAALLEQVADAVSGYPETRVMSTRS